MDLKLGDYVLYNNSIISQRVGRIEDHNVEQGWIEVFEYLKSSEIKKGRAEKLSGAGWNKASYGQNEVFKTKSLKKVNLSDIVRKVQVVKLREFQQLKFEQKDSDMSTIYLHRQEFDETQQAFLIPINPCICRDVVNPDEVVLQCQFCDRAYHPNCLKHKDIVVCEGCRQEIPREDINARFDLEVSFRQRVRRQEQVELDENEDEELSLRRPKQVIDLEKLVKKKKNNEGEAVRKPISKQKSVPSKPLDSERLDKTDRIENFKADKQQQASNIKGIMFKNINDDQKNKIKKWVERYHLMETNLGMFEKKRQDVRERLFSVIYYGVLEMMNLESDQLSPNEKKFISQEEAQLFMGLKNLALEIEVMLHLRLNNQSQNRMEQGYIDRCKVVYMHLKDDKNFDLRRKVISREFTATDLCLRDERDLYNPEKRQQMKEIQIKGLETNANEQIKQPEQIDNGLNSMIEEQQNENNNVSGFILYFYYHMRTGSTQIKRSQQSKTNSK